MITSDLGPVGWRVKVGQGIHLWPHQLPIKPRLIPMIRTSIYGMLESHVQTFCQIDKEPKLRGITRPAQCGTNSSR